MSVLRTRSEIDRDREPRTAQFEIQLTDCPHHKLKFNQKGRFALILPVVVDVYWPPKLSYPHGTYARLGCTAEVIYNITPSAVRALAAAIGLPEVGRLDERFVCEHMGRIIE